MLRRRWKLIVTAGLLVPAVMFVGGYAYFFFETRGAPPPLELGSPPKTETEVTLDGIWRSRGGGRLEIVGSWITAARLPPSLKSLSLPMPIDLTHLRQAVSYRVALQDGRTLNLLWRAKTLRVGLVKAGNASAVFTRATSNQ